MNDMKHEPWLTILGIGDNSLKSLSNEARQHFDKAEHIIAPERVLAALLPQEVQNKKLTAWKGRFHDLIDALKQKRGEPVTILATGDPMHFGIAATLMRYFKRDDFISLPHPSGFSLAANLLGWPLQNVETISLHGRSIFTLNRFIEPGARLLALTSTGRTIHEAAAILVKRGFEHSRITVLEHIGGVKEKIKYHEALEIDETLDFADFNMLAINCIAGENPVLLPRVSGLPDAVFIHDGQLTKSAVRAVTLSALRPFSDALLWDIGAGCGSVAIEWMRAAPNARALAFEREETRLSMIEENRNALGVPNLEIIKGNAPEILQNQERPNAVFIGGGLTQDGLFEKAYESLVEGGVVVVNAVTLEGDAILIEKQKHYGGELVRLDVSTMVEVGSLHALQPRMSVLQFRCEKR